MNGRTQPVIDQARQGDVRAWAELFELHWKSAWQVAFAISHDRELADDGAQEGLVRAFRSLDKYDTGRPLAPWIHRIVANCTLDMLRRESRQRRPADGRDFASFAELQPELRALWPALGQLTVDHRSVLLLKFWFDYEPIEIAAILGIAAGTVHSRLHRALDQLRILLEATGEPVR